MLTVFACLYIIMDKICAPPVVFTVIGSIYNAVFDLQCILIECCDTVKTVILVVVGLVTDILLSYNIMKYVYLKHKKHTVHTDVTTYTNVNTYLNNWDKV